MKKKTKILIKLRPDIRTVAEHINNIRHILGTSISDLGNIFDVSRQAIYNWLAESSIPRQEKLARIIALSMIADQLKQANISRARSLFKMKTFSGRSLMDLVVSGEYTNEHVSALINEATIKR